MGFLDNIRDALRDAVSTQASKRNEVTTKDDVAVDDSATRAAPTEETPEAKFETYTVRTGDTLSEIGARFGVSHLEIAALNSIENPDLIFPGQVFRIPKT